MSKETYKKNFLADVILRVDFMNPEKRINESLDKSIMEEVAKKYNIPDIKDVVSIEKDEDKKYKTFKEWGYSEKTYKNRICFSEDCFFLNYKHYEAFEPLKKEFIKYLELLLDKYKEITITRLGLRYINAFDNLSGHIFDWQGYFNEGLLASINFSKGKDTVRILSSIEYNFDDFNIRFNYGMPNPDYPSIIKKKSFVLDYDAYNDTIITTDDMKTLLPKMNNMVYGIFEESIDEKTRMEMRK